MSSNISFSWVWTAMSDSLSLYKVYQLERDFTWVWTLLSYNLSLYHGYEIDPDFTWVSTLWVIIYHCMKVMSSNLTLNEFEPGFEFIPFQLNISRGGRLNLSWHHLFMESFGITCLWLCQIPITVPFPSYEHGQTPIMILHSYSPFPSSIFSFLVGFNLCGWGQCCISSNSCLRRWCCDCGVSYLDGEIWI